MSITPITGDWRRFCEIVYDRDEVRSGAELVALLRRCAFAHPEWAAGYILDAWNHAAFHSLADARRERAREMRLLRLNEIREVYEHFGVDKAAHDAWVNKATAPDRDSRLAALVDEDREHEEFMFSLLVEEARLSRRAIAGMWTNEPLRELGDDESVDDDEAEQLDAAAPITDSADDDDGEDDGSEADEGDGEEEAEEVPELLLTLELRVWLAVVSRARSGRVTLNQQDVAGELRAWASHVSRAVSRLRQRLLLVPVGKEGRRHVYELPSPALANQDRR